MSKKYNTILLKLSGEALSGENGHGICPETMKNVAGQIAVVAQSGVRIGIVVGAGNIWRGKMDPDMNRSIADNMGMAATLINSLAMKDYIIRAGVCAEVLSAVPVDKFADYYTNRRAMQLLDEGCVVIFACGTGNPFFTTDTAGALRACEIDADAFIQAKNVDAVYESNPDDNPNARKFKRVSYQHLIENSLQAFDMTASVMCSDNNIDSVLFSLRKENAIVNACDCQNCGTIISNDDVIEYYE